MHAILRSAKDPGPARLSIHLGKAQTPSGERKIQLIMAYTANYAPGLVCEQVNRAQLGCDSLGTSPAIRSFAYHPCIQRFCKLSKAGTLNGTATPSSAMSWPRRRCWLRSPHEMRAPGTRPAVHCSALEALSTFYCHYQPVTVPPGDLGS